MKIFLIWPWGVGKSSSGKILARLLDYTFIDLDTEFCEQIDNIGIFIKKNGYEKYCYENSRIFYTLLEKYSDNYVFVPSSGFLAHENLNKLTEKHLQTLQKTGISILLLPSKSLEESTNIILERQLNRGFWLIEEKERNKFIHRFEIYKHLWNIQIFSHNAPEVIAEEMKQKLSLYNSSLHGKNRSSLSNF